MTEDQFKQLLEQNNAILFGQLSRHLDTRLDALRDDLQRETNRIYDAVDGLTKRVETDEQERTAIIEEQRHHQNWITQLAHSTGIKLIRE